MLRAVIALLVLLIPSVAQAQGRIALLIGNQAYKPKVGPLKNPHDDIALVGAALRSLGFSVTEVTDPDYRSMAAAIKRHTATVRREGQGTVSLLYYSGQGAADADTKTNYLIPVDVADANDADLWNYSLNLNNIIEGLRAQAPATTHYVVFDACRNELNITRKGRKALTDKQRAGAIQWRNAGAGVDPCAVCCRQVRADLRRVGRLRCRRRAPP